MSRRPPASRQAGIIRQQKRVSPQARLWSEAPIRQRPNKIVSFARAAGPTPPLGDPWVYGGYTAMGNNDDAFSWFLVNDAPVQPTDLIYAVTDMKVGSDGYISEIWNGSIPTSTPYSYGYSSGSQVLVVFPGMVGVLEELDAGAWYMGDGSPVTAMPRAMPEVWEGDRWIVNVHLFEPYFFDTVAGADVAETGLGAAVVLDHAANWMVLIQEDPTPGSPPWDVYADLLYCGTEGDSHANSTTILGPP